MKKSTRLFALILAGLCLLPFASCADGSKEKDTTKTEATGESTEAATEADPFVGLDYGGKEFRINTSTNQANANKNSNFMIESPGETTGDRVSDAAFERNLYVEQKLNIKFEFTDTDLQYDKVVTEFRMMMQANEDQYDLIINDLYPFAQLSVTDDYFCNVLDEDASWFDFTKSYWYEDYMNGLTFADGYLYLIAGDYFADVIRSAHCMVYNKTLYNSLGYGEPDDLYDVVADGKWTQEKMYQLVKDAYADNGNGKIDAEDRFGLILNDSWGCSIPFITSGDCNYLTRDEDGFPVLNMNTERSLELADSIHQLFYNDGTYIGIPEASLAETFANNGSLFIGYQRLGSLEGLSNYAVQKGIIPYPKLREEDTRYITSSHDTTEIGVIPTTAYYNLNYISAVIECLCRQTGKTVMSEYYETALKVRYASDSKAAAMLDIIHDNFDNTFQLAYDTALGDLLKNCYYYGRLEKAGSNAYTSKYKNCIKTSNTKLNTFIATFQKRMDS